MKLPAILAELRQFCCRGGPSGKQPFTRAGDKLTAKWTRPETWMTLQDALNVAASGISTRDEKDGEWKDFPIVGIGFINAKADDSTKQIIGGDLDACRDPETGALSTWAERFLADTQPFYTEVSPSECGIRMFYLGHLPGHLDKISGNGDQEIDEETKGRIIAKKPKIKEKLDKGEPAWNGFELYEAGRHLTLTGIGAKNYDVVDRTAKLAIALLPLIAARPAPRVIESGWLAEMREASENRLPKLSIMQVIDTSGWERAGDQIRGPHPTMGSTSGVNVVVNPSQNSYCWMHNNINAGGDAWVWLAHECGAAPWEASGEGLLRDPVIKARTIEYAISKGLVKKEDFSEKVLQAKLRLEDVAVDVGEDEPKWKFSPTLAATSILKTMKLAMEKGCDKIYYFNGQIFVPDGERIINNMLVEAGRDLASIKNKKETVAILHDKLLDFPVVFDSDPYLLGVKNGLVDLRTGEFRAYQPNDLITDQILVTYEENATCPTFVRFIKEIAPNETDQAMLVDWFAIHAIKLMFPYVMFLNGLGRNGKGIYERVLQRFFGDASFSGMPLEELDTKNNRFAGIGLYKKRGQIVSEAGEDNKKSKRSISTNYLKNVTGDGMIDTDQKNQGRIKFKPFCKATIDSNDMPVINDTSKGWMERFCKADLPFQYVDDPDPEKYPMERQKDPKLFEKLTTEEEFSGILNLIIERTINISKTMTITKRSGAEMFGEYQKQSNSVLTFLETFCEFHLMGDSKKDIFLDIVYKAYSDWCDLLVCDKVNDKRFGAAIKTFCDGQKAERVNVVDEEGKIKTKRLYRGFVFDANRYQCHLNHCYAVIMPSKSISVPFMPSKQEKTDHVNKDEKIIEGKKHNFCENGTDSDCKNTVVADSGGDGTKHKTIDTDIDLVEVVFKTDYNTDIDGKMQKVEQGDTLKVPAGRAQAWQKRGVVEIVKR